MSSIPACRASSRSAGARSPAGISTRRATSASAPKATEQSMAAQVDRKTADFDIFIIPPRTALMVDRYSPGRLASGNPDRGAQNDPLWGFPDLDGKVRLQDAQECLDVGETKVSTHADGGDGRILDEDLP